MSREPDRLRTINRTIPQAFDDLVSELLIKAPGDRLGSCAMLISRLDQATALADPAQIAASSPVAAQPGGATMVPQAATPSAVTMRGDGADPAAPTVPNSILQSDISTLGGQLGQMPVPKVTTHGRAVGESAPSRRVPRRRGSPLAWLAGGVAVAVGVALVVVQVAADAPAPKPGAGANAGSEYRAVGSQLRTDEAIPGASPAAGVAPVADSPAREVSHERLARSLRVISAPSGATVTVNGVEQSGVTPLVVGLEGEFARASMYRVTVDKAGLVSATVVVAGDEGFAIYGDSLTRTVDVRLAAEQKRRPKRRRRRAKPGTSAKESAFRVPVVR